ncbi:MAG: Do family serine endopeptidase [candidate division Zixibacteria bacterium]|nr:Do family serine endopeptidase [candidate division Zixibacteria bacterium]
MAGFFQIIYRQEQAVSKEYNFRKGFLIYSLSSLLFILVGILIASGLSLPDSLTAFQPAENKEADVIKADYQFPLNEQGESPFVAVASRVKDAVVNISAESIKEGGFDHSFLDDDFFRRFFGMPENGDREPVRRRSESLGSGFIISADGYIVTNNHVVREADKIRVRLSNTAEYSADLVGTDPETDIALLKINPSSSLTSIKLGDSDAIRVGDWAIAIGNPFPQLGLDRTVTVGVISAKGREGLTFGGDIVSYQDYIQTDASINRGNSGGPLVNIRGEVIGINSAIASTTGGSVGIGFAIPVNLAKTVIEALKESGEVARGWLGVSPQAIDRDLAEAMDLPGTEGVIIGQVIPDSPAEEAGFETGDVIVEFDGTKITDLKQFRFRVAETPPNREVEVKIIRNGDRKTLRVELGNRAEALDMAQSGTSRESDRDRRWLGIKAETFTEEAASQLRLDFQPGVIITDLEVGSPAEVQGLEKFDLILEVDGERVRDEREFYEVADKLSNRDKAIPFFIKRRGATRYIAVKP